MSDIFVTKFCIATMFLGMIVGFIIERREGRNSWFEILSATILGGILGPFVGSVVGCLLYAMYFLFT